MISRVRLGSIGTIVFGLLAVLWATAPVLASKPSPVTITVTTTSDDVSPPDNGCSLRAAILASNGGTGGFCGTGTFGYDTIAFALGSGTPVIDITGDLPSITNGAIIDGATGGAKRVRLHGPGSGTGLDLSNAANTHIHAMVIDGFDTGINIADSSEVAVTHSVLGPNTHFGLESFASDPTIGGMIGLTPGGPCTGDCNIISGNGQQGLYVAAGGTIEGNFIGTTRSGTVAKPNRVGIAVSSGGWTIGAVSAGNLISGNTSTGLDLNGCAGCTIAGNLIGTDASGTTALPNGGTGIWVDSGQQTVVGGIEAGAGNVISGNSGDGVLVNDGAKDLTIIGNRIGVNARGSALGNGGTGVEILRNTAHAVLRTQVGVANSRDAANIIAWNAQGGVMVGSGSSNQVRADSIHDNGGPGITVAPGINGGILPPVITSSSPLSGTACAACAVDIYSDSGDEGRIFEGSTVANGSGAWTYPHAVIGPRITATATNGSNDTSAFSAPARLPHRPDALVRLGTGVLIGDDRYNTTGSHQTANGSGARNSTITFGISLRNDGSTTERFKVAVTGSATSMFTVSYFHGTTNITTGVVAGTLQTPMLSTGQGFGITVKVAVRSNASAGKSVTRLVTVSSSGAGQRRDAVKFVASRR